MAPTFSDILDQDHIDIPVKVTSCRPGSRQNRAYEMTIQDVDGVQIQFIVWDKSEEGRSVDWQEGRWYRLQSAFGKVWGSDRKLHGTSKLSVSPGEPPAEEITADVLLLPDTHLGKTDTKFYLKGNDLDTIGGFESAIDVALSENVDAVIHLGDIFHNDSNIGISNTLKDVCRENLTRLADADIPFLFIYGNHEKEEGRNCLREFQNAGLATHLGTKPVEIGRAVAIYGGDHRSPWTPNMLQLEQPTEGTVTLLCLHQSVSPITGNPNPDCRVRDVLNNCTIDLAAIAIGHLHVYEDVRVNGSVAFCSGATERLTPGLTPSVDKITVENGSFKRQRIPLE